MTTKLEKLKAARDAKAAVVAACDAAIEAAHAVAQAALQAADAIREDYVTELKESEENKDENR